MAINAGTIKFILTGLGSALGGGSGYLINWPTKSIGGGKMQVLFKEFDFETDKSPWTSLMHKKTDQSGYSKPDDIFDKEIVDLRNKLKNSENCINSTSSSGDECCGEWGKIKEKIGTENINTLKNYCKKKESDEITGQNLNSMKGYMAICYDMSEIWYWA